MVFTEIFRLEGHVAVGESDGFGLDLGDPATRTDGMIIHHGARFLFVAFCPFG